MPRYLTIACAQLGPIEHDMGRAQVVSRLVALLRQAKAQAADLVVFPEMALTTFFARSYAGDAKQVEKYFERTLPGPETQPLFDAASHQGLGFYLGYGEIAQERGREHRYNASVLVGSDGRIIGKYRKVHVPGSAVYDPTASYQYLEKFYFEDGNLGFPVWRAFGATVGMAICNDRRWPETYRVMALKGAELVVLGFNTPSQMPDYPEQNGHRPFHHLVCMQAAAYQNGIWIAASAKAGREAGVDMMGHSCIIAPSGDVVALSQGLGDETVVYRCDLDMAAYYKKFHGLEENRRPEHYGLIAEPSGGLISRAAGE
jgi:predicted amidohydrolase